MFNLCFLLGFLLTRFSLGIILVVSVLFVRVGGFVNYVRILTNFSGCWALQRQLIYEPRDMNFIIYLYEEHYLINLMYTHFFPFSIC